MNILSLLVLFSLVGSGSATTGTFSLAAYDSLTGELGVVVQSRAFNVGMAVPWVEAGVGAIATQASTNESFGPKGLKLLQSGLSAQETLDWLIGHDPGKDHRQIGVVDSKGNSASFTGEQCLSWAGDTTGYGFACQGNILAGKGVVEGMVKAFQETDGELGERLLAALVAGQKAGGDKRGKQSAALLIVRPSEEFPEYNHRYVDIRVDDHKEPIKELIRLYRILEATDLTESHLRFAETYEKEGKPDLARREREWVGRTLKRVLKEGTKNAGLLNALAWSVATHDMFLEEALEAAKRAVKLEPKSWEILDTLAEVYFRLDNRKKAIKVGERALKLSPGDNYLKEQIKRFRKGGK